MRSQWNTEGCHSHLIGADILLAFTFPPSLDTWNQPWFSCQMVSISWLVRCIRTTSRWITVLIVCQSLIFQCGASQRFLFLCFSAIPPPHRVLILKALTVYRGKIASSRPYLEPQMPNACCVNIIALSRWYSVTSLDLMHSIMRRWEWLWPK